MKKKILKKKMYLVFFLVGAISFSWFKAGYFVWGDDAALPINLYAFISEYFSLVSWKVAFSSPDASKVAFIMPIGTILGLVQELGIPYSPQIFQKTLIWFVFSFSGISAAYLFTVLFRKKEDLSAIGVGLFYMFNIYSLIAWHAFSWIVFFYSFFPLVLALYIKGLKEKKDLRFFIFISLIWTILVTPAYGTPPFMITSWAIIFSFLFYYTFTSTDRIIALLKTTFLFFIWLLMNSFWIVPQWMFYKSEFIRRAVPETDPLSLISYNSSTLSDLFRFLGPTFLSSSYKSENYYPWFSLYFTPFFIVLGSVITILVFLSLFVKHKEKETYFIISMLLIFLLLASGTYSPFPQITNVFYNNLRMSEIFRSVWQRFMPLVVLFSSLLFGLSISYIINWLKSKKLHMASLFTYLVIILLVCGIYAFPFWTDKVYPVRQGVLASNKVKFPQEYYDTAKWFDNQKEDFNILPIPFTKTIMMPLQWENGQDGFWGGYPFLYLSDKRYIVTDTGEHLISNNVKNLLNNKATANDLNNLNIKYIIDHKDANFKYMEGNPNFIMKNLHNNDALTSYDFLKKVATFGKLDIHENIKWTPNYFRFKNTSESNITYKKVIPGYYKVYITNINQKTELVLAEIFNKGYVLKIDKDPNSAWCTEPRSKGNITQCKDDKKLLYFGAAKNPKNYLMTSNLSSESFNFWMLDPQEIEKTYPENYYKKNPDGSIDIETTIMFSPNIKFYRSLLLSFIIIFSLFAFLIIKRKTNAKNKKI